MYQNTNRLNNATVSNSYGGNSIERIIVQNSSNNHQVFNENYSNGNYRCTQCAVSIPGNLVSCACDTLVKSLKPCFPGGVIEIGGDVNIIGETIVNDITIEGNLNLCNSEAIAVNGLIGCSGNLNLGSTGTTVNIIGSTTNVNNLVITENIDLCSLDSVRVNSLVSCNGTTLIIGGPGDTVVINNFTYSGPLNLCDGEIVRVNALGACDGNALGACDGTTLTIGEENTTVIINNPVITENIDLCSLDSVRVNSLVSCNGTTLIIGGPGSCRSL